MLEGLEYRWKLQSKQNIKAKSGDWSGKSARCPVSLEISAPILYQDP